MSERDTLSTWDIARLSLVRFGANLLIILTTGVLNRLLIVEGKMAAIWVSFVLSLQNFACPLAIYTGYLSDEYEKKWYPDKLPDAAVGMKKNREYVLGQIG